MSAEQTFQETLLTLDLVDQLRQRGAELDAALNSEEQMNAMREKLRAFYQSNGIEVTDELLNKAIEQRQQQRLILKQPALSWFTFRLFDLWRFHVEIAQYLAACTIGLLLVYFAAISWTNYQHRRELVSFHDFTEHRATHIMDLARELKNHRVPVLNESALELPRGKSWQTQLAAEFERHRSEVDSFIQRCERFDVPASFTAKEYDDGVRLSDCESLKTSVTPHSDKLAKLDRDTQLLNSAASNYRGAFETFKTLSDWAAAASEWQGVQHALLSDEYMHFVAALERFIPLGTRIEANLSHYYAALQCVTDAASSSKLESDRLVMTDLQKTLNGLRTTPSISSTNNTFPEIGRASKQCQLFKTPLTLRVVNRPGEKTGVWRYYDGDRNKKTFYIVVEAIDSTGNPRALSIENSETNTNELVTTFAVRTSEDHFELVKADKMDDGHLTHDQIGEKPANTLQWTLDADYQSHYITRW